MKKCISLLILIIAVLAAPIAHAAGVDGVKDATKVNKDYKSNDTKPKLKDDCCAHGLSFVANQSSKDSFHIVAMSNTIADDDAITSVAAGPPLKPPSHV